ncbi:MAG: hypothetical protein AAGF77_12545, partial [Bacteroidota bacterium]
HTTAIMVIFMLWDSHAQGIKKLQLEDFDLKGAVKTCQVVTGYGQEIFDFDTQGRLIKSTTKFSAQDKDITTYRYQGAHLVEKRTESYKGNVLDRSSSMAHFYKIDSTSNTLITEQIVSYDRAFIELQEYHFNSKDQLVKIVTSHENAVDETAITYTGYRGERTATFYHNGVITKSERKSRKKTRKGTRDVILEKTYLDGDPNKAVEKQYNTSGLLLREEHFYFDPAENQFVSQSQHSYRYDSDKVLTKEVIARENTTSEKDYIFQFDDQEVSNWVKKIVTPDNDYTTRKISYYETTSEALDTD